MTEFLTIAPSGTSQFLARAIVAAYAERLGRVDVEAIARIIDREMNELEEAEHRMPPEEVDGTDYTGWCELCGNPPGVPCCLGCAK